MTQMPGQFRYSDEFKIDAVAQVTERGCSVKEVAERLGISTKSLYTWMAQFSKPQRQTDQEAEVRRLKKELARVTEERDILKKGEACPPLVRGQCRARTSPGMQSEVRVYPLPGRRFAKQICREGTRIASSILFVFCARC